MRKKICTLKNGKKSVHWLPLIFTTIEPRLHQQSYLPSLSVPTSPLYGLKQHTQNIIVKVLPIQE